jgi:serine protease AprX
VFLQPNFPHSGTFSILPTPQRIGALPEWTGRGVVMAFVDSGFYPHRDLGSRVLVHADATTVNITEGTRFQRPHWYSWHGQMTSVVAAGNGAASHGLYRGVAPDAQLVLVKISTERRRIKERDILRGLDWVIANIARFNIRIVNLSVGGDQSSNDFDHPIFQAIRLLDSLNVVVVTAVGNSGTPQLVPPASSAEAISVGGYDDRNSLDTTAWTPYHHNYGLAYDGTSKPDILAPAAWIASPILPKSQMEREARWLAPMFLTPHTIRGERRLRQLIREGSFDLGISRSAAHRPTLDLISMLQSRINKYKVVDAHHQHVDGTSVSSAIVSSVVAQMLEANPSLTPRQIKTILHKTGILFSNSPIETQGGGILNAAAAVQAALGVTSS